ncbi:hypothetical protein B0T25DRAFT_503791 [Lasiosphaeria hispida]|uniref:Uncharacterized protein n=1 Tax=Lasiosphaeria hispida TaxID=260671 RepID=A0AAJ0HDK6_9PEZI|nr:hypothetical protein B0T25DRAFT_503791 [Lasiosphaeria hispida]
MPMKYSSRLCRCKGQRYISRGCPRAQTIIASSRLLFLSSAHFFHFWVFLAYRG